MREIIYYQPPEGTVTFNGTIKTSGIVYDMTEIDCNDAVEVNFLEEGLYKFLVWGINAKRFFGVLKIHVEITSRFEFDMDIMCVDAFAKQIPCNRYYEKRWTYRGINKRLIES